MIPKWHFIPTQVILEWVHSGFHSKWNSHSGKKFLSLFRIVNHKSYSLRWVALAYLIWCANHTSKNTLGWAVQFYHGTELTPEWKSLQYRINSPLVFDNKVASETRFASVQEWECCQTHVLTETTVTSFSGFSGCNPLITNHTNQCYPSAYLKNRMYYLCSSLPSNRSVSIH